MGDKMDMTDAERIVNRHTARLLTNLEQAGCSWLFIKAIKDEMAWLKDDLNEMIDEKVSKL